MEFAIRSMHDLLEMKRFERCVSVIGLQVLVKDISQVIVASKSVMWRRRQLKNVITLSPEQKMILLDPALVDASKDPICLPDTLQSTIDKLGVKTVIHKASLAYNNFTMDQVLREIIPPEITELPSAFETAGHIAHLNLREEILPYKHMIGQVIIDKNPCIKTVVNKTGNIETEFRTFPLEILAGENNLNVVVKQGQAVFKFDFSKVYWNSRLEQEHKRLVERFKSGDIVIDAFCGVGPFVLPAAMKGCIVYANDLNPNSYTSLLENLQRNHVSIADTQNIDARRFIRQIILEKGVIPDHIVMNLPGSALEFLDCLVGLPFQSSVNENNKRERTTTPMVHCYCFSNEEDYQKDILNRANSALETEIFDFEISLVRSVAPRKTMYCLHFPLKI